MKLMHDLEFYYNAITDHYWAQSAQHLYFFYGDKQFKTYTSFVQVHKYGEKVRYLIITI